MKDDPLTYMLRAPGCVTGPCESLFSVAATKCLEMPKGTEIVPLYERPTEASQPSQDSVLADHNAGIAALQRDAARYRWLRERNYRVKQVGENPYPDSAGCGPVFGHEILADTLDEAIDAAMRTAT